VTGDPPRGGRRGAAALGTLVFLVLAPGGVAGVVPWLITQWSPLPPAHGLEAARWVGLPLIAVGLAVVLEAFARFAIVGRGTPAPVAPTRKLVVSGFYRFVRNPMYLAVAALIFGQAVLFASWGAALYGIVIAAAFETFVRLHEEPTLLQTYGAEYAAYCAAVPRWIPRLPRPPADSAEAVHADDGDRRPGRRRTQG
jgi:protein-S-isoprenylcysteine O-methyltransferase Ste14